MVSPMNLTWHDAAATVPVAAAAGIYAAYRADAALPLLSGPRALATAVFLLGVTACALGGGIVTSDTPPPRTSRLMGLWLHGPAAFLITVIVWVTGSPAVLAALVALVALMWLFARIHHVYMPADNRSAGKDPVNRPVKVPHAHV